MNQAVVTEAWLIDPSERRAVGIVYDPPIPYVDIRDAYASEGYRIHSPRYVDGNYIARAEAPYTSVVFRLTVAPVTV